MLMLNLLKGQDTRGSLHILRRDRRERPVGDPHKLLPFGNNILGTLCFLRHVGQIR
jgi:hypothetical protein